MSFQRRKPGSTCRIVSNAVYSSERKVESKFQKRHLSRILYPTYSPGISPCDISPIDKLNKILKDWEFTLNNESEDVMTMGCNDLTFDDAQSVFRNWTRRLA
jgi:hypothetical protein